MINIAVCDDDIGALNQIKDMTERWCASHGRTAFVSAFPSGEALLNAVITDHHYDLYILDVLMPDTDGIALGKKLRANETIGNDVPIIYLSSSREFAVDSYAVRAFYYLLKPVSFEQFDRVVTEAAAHTSDSKSHIIPVRTKSGTYPVTYDEICYVILENRSLTYLCFDRTVKSLTIPGSFKSATESLCSQPQFFQCGASMLVNLERIKSIDKNDVTFTNDVRLSVPRNTAKPLYKAWLDFWLE